MECTTTLEEGRRDFEFNSSFRFVVTSTKERNVEQVDQARTGAFREYLGTPFPHSVDVIIFLAEHISLR